MSDRPKAFFENGSARSEHALMYDLIPIEAFEAYAERMGFGFQSYAEENWKKGGPMFFRETKRHAMAHWLKYMAGQTDDKHLDAAFCNLGMLIWWERTGKAAWEVSNPIVEAAQTIVDLTYDPVLAEIKQKFANGGVDSLDTADKQYLELLMKMNKAVA